MYRKRKGTSARELFLLVLFVMFTVGGVLVFMFVNTDMFQGSDVQPIVQSLPTAVADEPTPEATQQSGATTHIQIPAAGVNAAIIEVYLDGESWDVSELGTNVGHLQGTAWMGPQRGNIVLSGHVEMRDGRKGVFARIGELTAGDIIILQHNDEMRRYSIFDIRNVEPTDLTPVYPTTDERLTLITCDDFNFLQNSYQQRTIVVAERIS